MRVAATLADAQTLGSSFTGAPFPAVPTMVLPPCGFDGTIRPVPLGGLAEPLLALALIPPRLTGPPLSAPHAAVASRTIPATIPQRFNNTPHLDAEIVVQR